MKKQVAVIGLGRLGSSLATTLYELGHEVLALDNEADNVQKIASQVTHAVQADATDEAALRALGISNLDIAIVTLSDVEQNVLTTILLKKLKVPYVMARANNDLHWSILEKIGADRVFYPEREMGIMLAHVLTLGEAIDYIPVAPQYGVVKLNAPDSFVGKTLSELGFGEKGKWKVTVLLVLRKQGVVIAPPGTEVVKTGDTLVFAGEWERLEALFTGVQKASAKG